MKLLPVLSEWTLTSTFLIMAVLALRALLGKRVGAGLRYALWAVVLARLLVPVQLFPSPTGTSILRETGLEQLMEDPTEWEVPYPAVSAAPALSDEPPEGEVLVYHPDPAPVTVRVEPLTVLRILGWLWLAGTAAMAAAFLLSNASFAHRLRRVRTRLEGADCPLPVYVTPGLPSPCLFGLARPAVYITPETVADPDMLRHVLTHEYIHASHGDHIWNVLRSAALALHWWNPLVWLAAVLSRRDCELACDEGALKRLGEAERFAYGRTLLALITVKPRPTDLLRCATTMTGGQKSVRERVERIARLPKRWLWAAVLAMALTALSCVCAFGSAVEPEPWDPSSVTADLTFSLVTGSDGNPYVRMDGAVDGVDLTRGAFWNPDWWHGDYYEAELTLMYPPFTDGLEGHIEANWEGGSGPEVTISTRPAALSSSDIDVGWWVLFVNLDNGTVQREQCSAEGGTHFYPASISDKEALRAARIAAKLLTAGKDYYKNQQNPFYESPYSHILQNGLFYSVDLEKWITLDDLLKEEKESGSMAPGFEASEYTLVDLDGDGRNEPILWIAQEGVGETYLIFHQLDGRLYGYFGMCKSMQDLKTDGTFFDHYLFSTEWDRQGQGYSRVTFTEAGLEFHPFTYSVSLPGDLPEEDKYVYVADGKTVDIETYSAAITEQDAKSDAVWLPLQTGMQK